MKVKDLIKALENQDKESEVVIRFGFSEDDEVGYVLETCATGNYFEKVAIYANYTSTKEDCDIMGQVDLKTLWEKEYYEEDK